MVPELEPAAVPTYQLGEFPFTTVQPLAEKVEVAFSNPPSLALINCTCPKPAVHKPNRQYKVIATGTFLNKCKIVFIIILLKKENRISIFLKKGNTINTDLISALDGIQHQCPAGTAG